MKYTESDLSLVIPSRRNLKYLKWGYKAIRQASKDICICYADDASHDDTWSWLQELMETDPNVKALCNSSSERFGLTIMYDKVVDELVTTPLVLFYHADMYCFDNTFKNMLKHYVDKSVITSTRIEPPMHPDGPEKHVFDMGFDIEDFKAQAVTEFASSLELQHKDVATEGFFAPWLISVEDFKAVGGHDAKNFAPQGKEDSDIANRFQLNGYKLLQSRDSFVAHLTCRGSRRNPELTTINKDSDEWTNNNMKVTRNFIRKWGTMVRHDPLMKPIIPHKYDIAFRVNSNLNQQTNFQLLNALEPWCSHIQCGDIGVVTQYILEEQPNTKFNLHDRVSEYPKDYSDVLITFTASEFLQNQQENFQFIQNLPDILTESGEVGEMEYGCFKIIINALTHHEKDLIVCGK